MRVEEDNYFAGCTLRARHSSFNQTLSLFVFYNFDFIAEHMKDIFPEWQVKIFESAFIVYENDFVEKIFRRAIVDRVNTSKQRAGDFIVEGHYH